jgi:Helix-turn-helix domain
VIVNSGGQLKYKISVRAAGAWSPQPPPYLHSVDEREFASLKEEWLHRTMMIGALAPSHRVAAYFIVDSLNWATMDCWPSHERLAGLVGVSSKTIQRALSQLEAKNLLAVYRRAGSSHPLRYSPIYLTVAKPDTDVPQIGHVCPEKVDIGVHQPFLKTLPESSLKPATEQAGRLSRMGSGVLPFKIAERGRIEMQVAPLIGGFDLLSRLAAIHDGIVTRLCVAHQTGCLDARQVRAARLAAAQSQQR